MVGMLVLYCGEGAHERIYFDLLGVLVGILHGYSEWHFISGLECMLEAE